MALAEEILKAVQEVLRKRNYKERVAYGERYYFVCSTGRIDWGFDDRFKTVDDVRYSIGNYFHTEKEAKRSKLYEFMNEKRCGNKQ